MGKRGRPPILPFGSIKRRGYTVAPAHLPEHAVRNAASLWSRTYGIKLSVRLTDTTNGRELRVYRPGA